MSHAVIKRLRREGPIQAWLSEEDYRYLKERFRRILRRVGPRSWDAEDRLIALGFLRGYTLYREIPENERQFWRHFFREVEFDHEMPTPRQFDELWDALRLESATRPYLVMRNGRRMLVQTIDRIWGVKGLRAEQFGKLLKRYLELRSELDKVEFGLLLQEFPELEVIVHHSQTYLRIFEGVYRLLRVLDREPELAWSYLVGEVSEKSFIAKLETMGLVFASPHPFAYVRNKSERLLRGLISKYVSLPHFEVEQGVFKRRSSKPVLTVEVNVEKVEGLSGLDSLEIIPDVAGRRVYREGRRVTGEIRLASGDRARFAWRPRLDQDGEPLWSLPEDPFNGTEGEVRLGFDDEEVRVRFSVRPRYVVHLELASFDGTLDWQRRDSFQPALKGAPSGELIYRLEGGKEAEQLDQLWPRFNDLLELVYRYRGESAVLERVPVRFAPFLEAWNVIRDPRGVVVNLKAQLPKDGRVRVRLQPASGRGEERVVDAEAFKQNPRFFFELPPLESAQIEIQLAPEGASARKSVPPHVDWKAAFGRGVGIGRLFP